MDTQTYFNMLAKSMAVNPPALPEDAPIVAEMAKIGLVPGKPFDLSKLAPDVQRALADVGKSAYALIAEQQKKGGKTANGWLLTTGTGAYGTNYLWRAAISAYGWAQIWKRTLSIPLRKQTPTARRWLAPIPTLSISLKVKRRLSMASGRSRCTIANTISIRTRSISSR
jgi:hypothetical protein